MEEIKRVFNIDLEEIEKVNRIQEVEDIPTSDSREKKSAEEIGMLQSAGGLNRFLGISIKDGRQFSVGKKGGRWVEWHPFMLESIEANFSEITFEIGMSNKTVKNGPLKSFDEILTEHAIADMPVNGELTEEIKFYVHRQSVGELCQRIARCVESYHSQKGLIHGDLKPPNILLTEDGPVLIDGFDVREGEVAPGWTPYWSAPELIMGEPVSSKSDIYPLGRIFTDLMGGYLVGEVRKFKVPPLKSGSDEFDIFYNPSVHIYPTINSLNDAGIPEWRKFIERCLRFHANERMNFGEFIHTLDELLFRYPLKGRIKFSLPGVIRAAVMPNGNHSVVRMISDYFEQIRPSPSAAQARSDEDSTMGAIIRSS